MDSKWKRRSRKIAREMYWEKHERGAYECPDCGRQEEQLLNTFEVHHKDGQPMDNRPENHIALCRPCHNLREGKKPSIEEIQNIRDSLDEEEDEGDNDILNGVNRIYTAGSMHYHNDEDSTWRASVQGRESTSAEIVSPKDVNYDHGGDLFLCTFQVVVVHRFLFPCHRSNLC
ncbi:hypothetical protein SAMN05192561_101591 [Halopenitus malekzadehii]|uniref:HNH nuclease domain-containing protein n=1 Tax=Halopenitus malekzadehii TaxID=1267564 RepID=A0A1H6I0V4_9EURY|nr:HNH endonuclease signature motif containing protein [Halopenitus malekzadehii]SEH40108.1 hypothetical protein SAMN05192561_101591 [Halopenitus malekzadehii]